MKVIDLMHKIRIDVILPKKIKIRNNIYHLVDDYQFNNINFVYERFRGNYWLDNSRLDDEVEIIEDKKIEKLTFENTFKGNSDMEVQEILVNKINELIEKIEKLKESK